MERLRSAGLFWSLQRIPTQWLSRIVRQPHRFKSYMRNDIILHCFTCMLTFASTNAFSQRHGDTSQSQDTVIYNLHVLNLFQVKVLLVLLSPLKEFTDHIKFYIGSTKPFVHWHETMTSQVTCVACNVFSAFSLKHLEFISYTWPFHIFSCFT